MNAYERELIAGHLLAFFVRESNHIEGIRREPTAAEIEAHGEFLDVPTVTQRELVKLLWTLEPGAMLRDRPGLNVSVGNHIPPLGGPDIPFALGVLLGRANMHPLNAWQTHVEYETLHPFTDGNGRTGRALWAWQMVRTGYALGLGFLHKFYYQTLQNVRAGGA